MNQIGIALVRKLYENLDVSMNNHPARKERWDIHGKMMRATFLQRNVRLASLNRT